LGFVFSIWVFYALFILCILRSLFHNDLFCQQLGLVLKQVMIQSVFAHRISLLQPARHSPF
jgi:hypothetical protein